VLAKHEILPFIELVLCLYLHADFLFEMLIYISIFMIFFQPFLFFRFESRKLSCQG